MKKLIFIILFSSISAFASNVYFVILCGGIGERLWPLSRKDHPKQLLPINNSNSMLEETISRVKTENSKIYLLTTQDQEENIKNHVGNSVDKVLIEPSLRNTAPAIAYSCLEIYKQDPESVVVFLPADHFIPEKDKFLNYLNQGINFVEENNKILLFGVKPNFPATGYGYIEYKKQDNVPFDVLNFHEKPSLQKAQNYIEQENFLWNCGIFCSKVKTFINEIEKLSPEVFFPVKNYLEFKSDYNLSKNISIDYAVMEKSSNISVLPVDFIWSDIGNLSTYLDLNKEIFSKKNNFFELNAVGNLCYSDKKIVAFIGAQDLCLVETKDAIVVLEKNNAEKIKDLLKIIPIEYR